MKAKDLAALLLQTPDAQVEVYCRDTSALQPVTGINTVRDESGIYVEVCYSPEEPRT